MLQTNISQSFSDTSLNAQQQNIMEDFRLKYAQIFKEEVSWNSMKNTYVNLYKSSFNQKEINGMIAFYKTESGQAVIRKMPLVVRNTNQLLQEKMKAVLPKIEKLQKASMQKIHAAQ